MEDDSIQVSRPSTPLDSGEACACSEDDTGPVRNFIWDTFNITSEVYLRAENTRLGLTLCDHGNSTLNFIKNKLKILKEYKEAIVDLCHNKLDYHKSVEKLEVAWNCVAALISSTSPEATKNLLYWVLRQTLHLMLVGEWTTLPSEKRNNIRITIEKSLPIIKCAPNSINRCEYILQYFDNPWSDKRLLAVLYGEARLLTQSDLDYLTTERGCMIVLRLQKLCETKCDEMAFTLSSKALLALRSVNTGHELRKSSSIGHVYFIFDIYLCLVHKFIGVNKFIEEVKRLGLYDALLLIKRNMNAETDCSRLVKFRAKVAKLSANITIATIMVDSLSDDNKHYYCAILKEWLKMHQKLPVRKFRDIARKLFSTACSSKHLHLACQIIKDMKIDEWGELLLELYVRVITADLNELELLKSEKTCSAEDIIDSEVNLSYRYIQIADLLKEQHPDLTHECILTAFSLNPTAANYCLVKAAAHQKQEEMKSRLKTNVYKGSSGNNAPVRYFEAYSKESVGLISKDDCSGGTDPRSTSLKIMNPASSKRVLDTASNSGISNHDVLAAPNLILDSIETIDLPSDIRIDLSVLLSSPRVKFLSWFQTWPDLQINCQRLLKPGGKLEIVRQGLAIANDHLQFLNLDYDQFRNLPENDGPGIEKGYEIFVQSDDDQSNHDSDFVVSDEGSQRKKRPKQPRQIRQSSSSSLVKSQPGYEEINAQLLQLSERKNSDPTRDPLDNSIMQNLLKQQSHLISPFNTFLLQYLSQTTERAPHSTAELDTLFRMFYIQQLQAQLQLSQSYTRALQLKVTPTKDQRQQGRPAAGKQKEGKKRPSKVELHKNLTVQEDQKARHHAAKQSSIKGNVDLASQKRKCSLEGNMNSNSVLGENLDIDPDKPSTSHFLLSQMGKRKHEEKLKKSDAPSAHVSRDSERLESNLRSIALSMKMDSFKSQKSKAIGKAIDFDIQSSKKKVIGQRTSNIDEQSKSRSTPDISGSTVLPPNIYTIPTSHLSSLESDVSFKSSFETLKLDEQRDIDKKSLDSATQVAAVSSQVPQISATKSPCSDSQIFETLKDQSDMAADTVAIQNSSEKSIVTAVTAAELVCNESYPGLESDSSSPGCAASSPVSYDGNENLQSKVDILSTDSMNKDIEKTRVPEELNEQLSPKKHSIDSFVSPYMSVANETTFTEPVQTRNESCPINSSEENFDSENIEKLNYDLYDLSTRHLITESKDPGNTLCEIDRESLDNRPIEENVASPKANPSEVIANPEKTLEFSTDSEIDDIEGEENTADGSRLKKGNDSDSDTDSSGSHALVVQLPRRTYSRISGSSDQQNSDQRSPSHKK